LLIINKINYLKQSLGSEGILRTLKIIGYGYLQVNKFIVLSFELKKPFFYKEKNENLQIMRITLDELHQLRTNHPGLPIQFYCDQTQGFTEPYVAFIDGEIVAIHWLVHPKQRSRFLIMRDNDAELNYNTVLHQYRGKRIAESLMAYIIKSNNASELKTLWGVVDVNNIPQWKSMIHLGFKPVDIITHWAAYRPKKKV